MTRPVTGRCRLLNRLFGSSPRSRQCLRDRGCIVLPFASLDESDLARMPLSTQRFALPLTLCAHLVLRDSAGFHGFLRHVDHGISRMRGVAETGDPAPQRQRQPNPQAPRRHPLSQRQHTPGLTRIYSTKYIRDMESTFAIIAEPSRRAILSLLASSEQSVGEIEEKLNLSQPSVSKHLRVLREAGFVEARVDAQRRLYRIKPEPLMEIDAWLEPFRRYWSVHVDALERHLDQLDPASHRKGKKA